MVVSCTEPDSTTTLTDLPMLQSGRGTLGIEFFIACLVWDLPNQPRLENLAHCLATLQQV